MSFISENRHVFTNMRAEADCCDWKYRVEKKINHRRSIEPILNRKIVDFKLITTIEITMNYIRTPYIRLLIHIPLTFDLARFNVRW